MELRHAARYGIILQVREVGGGGVGMIGRCPPGHWDRANVMRHIRLRRAAALFALLPALGFAAFGVARAQSIEIDELKGNVFDAKMAQQTFGRGVAHCGELNGTNFYMRQRDRVLDLEEYHRSLESLAQQRAFNPETKRPWTPADAVARWEQVQKQAAEDKRNCALIAHLPEMEKRLDELQKRAAAPNK